MVEQGVIQDTVWDLHDSMNMFKAFDGVASGLSFCYKAPLTSNIWRDFTESTCTVLHLYH